MSEFRESYLSAQDGLRLYWRDYGDDLAAATPVLCLSGLTRNCKDFHDLATRLAARRRVLCPDYRGRGRSEYARDPRSYDPQVYLQDLRHLLVVAGVSRCVVIGTSMGGVLAMALSVLLPTTVAGVVLNDIGPEVEQTGLGRIVDYIGTDRPQPDWDTAMAHLRELLPTLSFRDGDGWRKLTRNTFREGDDGMLHFDWDVRLVEGVRRMSNGRMPDLWPLFRGLSAVPVLAIRGSRSDVLSEATFARMAEALPGLRQVTVDGTGHAPALDEAEVVAAIDALLAQVDAAEGSPTWEEPSTAARPA